MGHKVGGRREVLAPPDEGCCPKPEVLEVAEPTWAAPGTTLQLGVSDTRLLCQPRGPGQRKASWVLLSGRAHPRARGAPRGLAWA